MSRSESANLLSGIALIRGPRGDRPLQADHTVIDTGDHRLSMGTIRITSVNDLYRSPPWFCSSSERRESADCVEEVGREVNRKSRGRGLAIAVAPVTRCAVSSCFGQNR